MVGFACVSLMGQGFQLLAGAFSFYKGSGCARIQSIIEARDSSFLPLAAGGAGA